jgi:predicted DNA-binding transcriptional regulator YafY
MTNKRATTPSTVTVTLERATRLYRLVSVLGKKPLTREQILQRLKIGVRDFYRDLNALERLGVTIVLEVGKYHLTSNPTRAAAALPFIPPEPGLTLGEVESLAQGRSKAHQKLGRLIKRFKSAPAAKRPRRA